jgi:hypothetical protein
MSYISILLPAFYTKETDLDELVSNRFNFKKLLCSKQFEKKTDEFELKQLGDKNSKEFAVKFHESDLSINKIEELIYQRDCLVSLVEKTYESLQTMSEKFADMESQIKAMKTLTTTETKISENDNQKFKDLLQYNYYKIAYN